MIKRCMNARTSASVRAAIASGLLCFTAGLAQAQTVYRCGNTYTKVPCPEGRIVEATDPRTAAQRAEAKRIAAQERRQATQMEQERLAQQAAQTPATATGVDSRAPAPHAAASEPAERGHTAKKRAKSKHREGDDFVATVPPTKKSRK